jgi:membrane protein
MSLKPWNKFVKAYRKCIEYIKQIIHVWSECKMGTFGAAVAYYAVFSIAPLLIIATSVTGLFVNESSVRATIIDQFRMTFGENGADFIQTVIQSKVSTQTSIWVTIVGFLILLIGATGVFSQMQAALNTIFESLPNKIVKGPWSIVRRRVLSLAMVLSLGFLVLLSLTLDIIIVSTSKYLSVFAEGINSLTPFTESIVSFILISFFLTLTYKVLPSKRLGWKPALVGGAIAGVLFTVSKYFLGVYFGSHHYVSGYGAASTIVLFVIWAYYMSQVFFLGAIFLRLYIIPKIKSRSLV